MDVTFDFFFVGSGKRLTDLEKFTHRPIAFPIRLPLPYVCYILIIYDFE